MNISDIYLFPLVNAQPAGTTYNPALPIQHWQVHPPAVGLYSYAFLDANGNLTFIRIPAAQANQSNIPDSGTVSNTETQNTAINEPPIDLAKYNALASQGLQVVANPFGLQIQPIESPAPAPSSSDSPLVQQIAADVKTILSKLP